MFFRELRLPTQKVVEAPTLCRFYAEKLGKITPKASDMPVTTKIYFDTRNEIRKKTNDYPYKLQVYCPDPKATRFYQTVYGATEEENQKLSASRLSDKLQSLKTTLQGIEDKAADAAHKLDPFCFDDFVRDYIKDNPHFDQARIKVKPQVTDEKDFDFTDYHKDFPILLETFDPATVGYVYQLVIKKKIVWGKIPTASLYQSSFVSLRAFGGNVRFQKITDTYLKFYTEWMKKGGAGNKEQNSKSTIGMYLRNLRHVFNVAASELKIINKEKCYPFGVGKYRIPSSRNVKKAFDPEIITALYTYACNPQKPWIKKAKSFWFFIYFGNGMNPVDVCNLKYKNISDGMIIFDRAKTEDTLAEDPPKITIVINADIQTTIDEYGNKDKSPENYIFPFFEPGMSPLQQYKARQNFIGFINQWMSCILKDLGLDKVKAGAYEARHSAATAQILEGATLLEVQEMLGQIDPRTTKRYIDSLPVTLKRQGAARLEAFKRGLDTKKSA